MDWGCKGRYPHFVRRREKSDIKSTMDPPFSFCMREPNESCMLWNTFYEQEERRNYGK